jgi:hypothetical protein
MPSSVTTNARSKSVNLLPSPTRLSSSIRYGATALTTTAALLLAGCGSAGGPHHSASHKLPSHKLASAAAFPAVHTAHQIVQHFQAATGETLTVNRDPVSWDTLSLPSSDTQAFDRYGTFTINVLHSPDELSTFTKDGGSRLVRDGNGIYWPPAPDSSGYWSPAKVYGNVVLTLTTQSRSVGNQFRMLDAILSTLGQGASAVNAKLPPNLLSCQARGITPGGTSEGTCTENGVSRTVVSRGHTLHVPGYDIQLTHTKLGNEIKSPFPYTSPMYAKGQFVAIGLHVTNNGDAPLDGLYDAELEIGGRYYSQDDQATFQIADPDTFPMQPEDSGNTAMIFDVPSKAAAGALTQGELVFPGEKDSTIDYASKLDAIRLGHVTVELSQPAPSGSPAPDGSPALSD